MEVKLDNMTKKTKICYMTVGQSPSNSIYLTIRHNMDLNTYL